MKLITSESAELAAKLNNSDASKQRSKVKQFRRKNISQKGEVKRPKSKQTKQKAMSRTYLGWKSLKEMINSEKYYSEV